MNRAAAVAASIAMATMALAGLATEVRAQGNMGALSAPVTTPPTVRTGDRVRLEVLGRTSTLVGRVERLAPDSVWVRTREEVAAGSIGWSNIQRVAVSRGVPGRRRRGWIGAALGGAVFGAAGYGIGSAIGTCADDCSTSPSRLGGAALGALVGAGFGALLGSIGGRERWEPAQAPLAALNR